MCRQELDSRSVQRAETPITCPHPKQLIAGEFTEPVSSGGTVLREDGTPLAAGGRPGARLSSGRRPAKLVASNDNRQGQCLPSQIIR